MLYALIGSSLLGALASALLLWRKSVAEKALAECRGQLSSSQSEAQTAKQALQGAMQTALAREAQLNEKISRANAELQTVKGQRDEAISKLPAGSIADILRAHASATNEAGSSANS